VFVGKHADLTEKIIGAFSTVYNGLSYGFSERVYENALVLELEKQGLNAEQPKQIAAYNDGQIVVVSLGAADN
jgi:GxxExxY protein